MNKKNIIPLIIVLLLGAWGVYISTKPSQTRVQMFEKTSLNNSIINIYDATVYIESYNGSASKNYGTGFFYKKDNKYGYIPLWILVKVLSFGIISELFQVLKPEDQKEIAGVFGVEVDTLIVYLPILANYRNLCAHEDILYENRTQKAIDDTVYHRLLKIEKEENEYVKGKYDLFALIIIIKQLLKQDEFKNMSLELDNIIETLNYNLNTIKIDDVLNRMGFPLNWKDLSKIERSIDKSE